MKTENFLIDELQNGKGKRVILQNLMVVASNLQEQECKRKYANYTRKREKFTDQSDEANRRKAMVSQNWMTDMMPLR